MGEGRLSGDSPSANRRLTVPEAAAALGITEAAVRGRVKRGTLHSYRESGTVYVLLTGDASETNHDAPTDEPTSQAELIAVLREQLAAERNAHAETRRIAYTLAQRIPQLEAPRDEPQSPETATDEPEGVEDPEPASAPHTTARRPWWLRWFSG